MWFLTLQKKFTSDPLSKENHEVSKRKGGYGNCLLYVYNANLIVSTSDGRF